MPDRKPIHCEVEPRTERKQRVKKKPTKKVAIMVTTAHRGVFFGYADAIPPPNTKPQPVSAPTKKCMGAIAIHRCTRDNTGSK